MNKLVLALAAAAVVAVGVVLIVTLGGDESPDSDVPAASADATDDSGPAALPSGSPSASDPFDFDSSTLDPEYVRDEADIHLACGQLLGEAQIARFLADSIGASEFTAGEHLAGGYHLTCKFWSDVVAGNFLRLEYWSGDETGGDFRTLAAFYASNRGMCDRAAQTF